MTPEQHRAAALQGAGHTREQIAEEIGVSPNTVQRWRKDPAFAQEVRRVRRAQLAENPTVEATLQAALCATKSDGAPDWKTRLDAVKLLRGWKPSDLPDDEADDESYDPMKDVMYATDD